MVLNNKAFPIEAIGTLLRELGRVRTQGGFRTRIRKQLDLGYDAVMAASAKRIGSTALVPSLSLAFVGPFCLRLRGLREVGGGYEEYHPKWQAGLIESSGIPQE